MNHRLYYIGYSAILEGYNDANWKYNTKDSKSINGYAFTLGGVVVS
jgi:hypothetical protein